MSFLRANQALVAADILLDGRLALFHQRERWLVVADLHFGYELSQRAAGRLVPMWGMESVAERLLALVAEYQPRHLIILGDLVHDETAAVEARRLLERLRDYSEPIVIAGNHDRQLRGKFELLEAWQTERFYFHHGHCAAEPSERIQIIGHHHPAGTISDGAGLRLKCPAFIQQSRCWIMPAFSPWSSGTKWESDEETRAWLCTPERILPLPENEIAPA
ncbi:MAG TPA: metallophosphoesterase [Chthoniobacterales bacterium]|jgi:DNA ligase-associated metallophosphoesterase